MGKNACTLEIKRLDGTWITAAKIIKYKVTFFIVSDIESGFMFTAAPEPNLGMYFININNMDKFTNEYIHHAFNSAVIKFCSINRNEFNRKLQTKYKRQSRILKYKPDIQELLTSIADRVANSFSDISIMPVDVKADSIISENPNISKDELLTRLRDSGYLYIPDWIIPKNLF